MPKKDNLAMSQHDAVASPSERLNSEGKEDKIQKIRELYLLFYQPFLLESEPSYCGLGGVSFGDPKTTFIRLTRSSGSIWYLNI